MKNVEKKFNVNMNILRGIAIFLVILGHAIFKDIILIKDIKNVKYYVNLYDFIYTFHMPLFFFISGFFAKKMFEIENKQIYFSYIKRKTSRLIIPYFAFSLIGLITKLLMYRYANDPINIKTVFINILFFPWENPIKLLWFIYTLYVIFLILPLFNNVNNKMKIIILVVFWCLPVKYGEIFNLNGVIRYSLFFILGYEFYKNYQNYIIKKKNIFKLIILTLLLIIININPIQSRNFVNIFTLISSLLAIKVLCDYVHTININSNLSRLFNLFGDYCIDIYLLHWFLQIPIRIIYEKLNFNYNIMFISALIIAFLSIPISKYILKKIPIFNYII
jgi:fucose 4-O-acetylase-like acetyltransferase